MGLPLQIFHAERCVRQCAQDGAVPRHALRNHRQRAKKFGLILCMASSIRPIFSRPRLRELLASSSAPLVASAARCARRALYAVDSSLRSSPSSACSILSRRSCRVWSRRTGRSRRTSQACRRWAWRPCGAKPAPAPCQARRRWGLSPCLLLSPCWLSSQPPSEPAASWKGSSMRARMTPTPEAPGRWRQVVCSCEGPPVRVPMPLKATRPRSSAM